MSNVGRLGVLRRPNLVSNATGESKKRVAVVGYGILGLTAVEFLDRQNYEVHIFDLDFDKDDSKFFVEPKGPKSLMHPMSSPIGSPGNLFLWGRAITNCIQKEFPWPRDFIDKVPKLSRKLVKYGFPQMDLQVHDSSETILKINHANMHKFSRRIYSSKHHLDVIRHQALVTNLDYKDGFVYVNFQNPEGSTEEIEFDFAIVCAGPINSFNLVSKSGLIPNIQSVNYLDHPTIWLGKIRTKKFVWIHSRLQNRCLVFGAKSGAIVISTEKDSAVTIRVRPAQERRVSRSHLTWRVLRHLKKKILASIGLIFSRNFSVAISFDLNSAEIRSVLIESEISELCYSNYGPKVDLPLLNVIEGVIGENFGAFEKTWKNEMNVFEETPAAHYAGFLGLLKDDKNESILDGFRLHKVPQISLPGSVSFPGPVIGHPTYLALLSVLYEVERINAIQIND
jgi:hypothetical protein